MGKPLQADWNEVKTLALAIGVREAARQMGLPEDAVMQRSYREGWIEKRREAQAKAEVIKSTIRVEQGLSAHVSTAAEVLQNVSGETKSELAVAALKVARHAAKQEPETLLTGSEDYSRWVSNAAKIHGWDAADRAGAGQAVVNITFLGNVQDSPALDV